MSSKPLPPSDAPAGRGYQRARQERVESMLERFNHLVERVNAVNDAPKRFGTDGPLHRAEIHTVQAIGDTEGLNMTDLARRMQVTLGAASQTVKKLEKKGLVEKRRSAESGREVTLALTPLGKTARFAHMQFHAAMFTAVQHYFGDAVEPGVATLRAALDDLIGLVDTFETITEERDSRETRARSAPKKH